MHLDFDRPFEQQYATFFPDAVIGEDIEITVDLTGSDFGARIVEEVMTALRALPPQTRVLILNNINLAVFTADDLKRIFAAIPRTLKKLYFDANDLGQTYIGTELALAVRELPDLEELSFAQNILGHLSSLDLNAFLKASSLRTKILRLPENAFGIFPQTGYKNPGEFIASWNNAIHSNLQVLDISCNFFENLDRAFWAAFLAQLPETLIRPIVYDEASQAGRDDGWHEDSISQAYINELIAMRIMHTPTAIFPSNVTALVSQYVGRFGFWSDTMASKTQETFSSSSSPGSHKSMS